MISAHARLHVCENRGHPAGFAWRCSTSGTEPRKTMTAWPRLPDLNLLAIYASSRTSLGYCGERSPGVVDSAELQCDRSGRATVYNVLLLPVEQVRSASRQPLGVFRERL